MTLNIKDRVAYYQKKHKELHDSIEALEAEKAPEDVITTKKKEKLALKDLIAELTNDE